jgi:hypothetical protein
VIWFPLVAPPAAWALLMTIGWWISGRGSASFAAGKYSIIDQSKLFTLGARAHFEMFEAGFDAVLIHDNGYERVDGYGLLASLGVSGVPRHDLMG